MFEKVLELGAESLPLHNNANEAILLNSSNMPGLVLSMLSTFTYINLFHPLIHSLR